MCCLVIVIIIIKPEVSSLIKTKTKRPGAFHAWYTRDCVWTKIDQPLGGVTQRPVFGAFHSFHSLIIIRGAVAHLSEYSRHVWGRRHRSVIPVTNTGNMHMSKAITNTVTCWQYINLYIVHVYPPQYLSLYTTQHPQKISKKKQDICSYLNAYCTDWQQTS